MRVLLVEDAAAVARSVAQGLSEEGFSVDVAHDGEDGLHLASEIAYDVIILDRMLPVIDGLTVLRRLRERGVRTPVLLLTALGEVIDRVEGLDAGADDYLVKPFAFEELLARVRALLRREHGHARNVVEVGALVLDLAARTASVVGRPLALTAREFNLLELLVLHPDTTFSRTAIIDQLYDEATELESNVIDVFVARLRRKLEEVGLPGLIRTLRGAGYRLDSAAAGGGAS
ncbi:MAG: response regulator transcription factor [Kofleriaceae bacterium]|nr:MAG: response regulator transcription factor [Kofleriaceae bacterium]MBZ0231895.1 response regulator transcription factor [Kofleriaceae bacterium]